MSLIDHAHRLCRGPTLTVNHTAEKLNGAVWQRMWSPHHAATAWPEGHYDTVLLPLPRGKESVRLCLNAAASVLNPGGQVLLYGLNDLGIKSADKVAGDVFDSIESIHSGDHGRIWRFIHPKTHEHKIEDFAVGAPPQRSYPGLFACGTLDEATALLLENLPAVKDGAAVMDFACGIGIIAHAVQKNVALTLVDNDPLALLAASQNVPGAACVLNGEPETLDGKFDIILSNPPIHEGNEKSFRIVDKLIKHFPQLLKKGGVAYIVAQVTVPVVRLAKEAGLTVEEVAASRSFRISRITL